MGSCSHQPGCSAKDKSQGENLGMYIWGCPWTRQHPGSSVPIRVRAFGESSCSSAGAEGTSPLQQQEPLPSRKVKAAG